MIWCGLFRAYGSWCDCCSKASPLGLHKPDAAPLCGEAVSLLTEGGAMQSIA